MPRVFISETERLCERFVSWAYGEMKRQQIPQKRMAEELDITPSALCQKLKNRSISYSDFLTMVRVLEPGAEEIAWLIGRRGSK